MRTEVTTPLHTRPVCTQYRETDLAFIQHLLGEEGLSYRFEHDQHATGGDRPGHALVIFDTAAALPDGEPASIRFHRIDATEQDDAISVFSERRQLVPDQVTTESWAPDQVLSVTGSAQAPRDGHAPELPSLDVFDADRAGLGASTPPPRHGTIGWIPCASTRGWPPASTLPTAAKLVTNHGPLSIKAHIDPS